jgi:hypothetical protein
MIAAVRDTAGPAPQKINGGDHDRGYDQQDG